MSPRQKKETAEVLQAEIVKEQPSNGGAALARYEPARQDLALTPAFDVDTAKKRHQELQKFVQYYLVEGEDFGTIPGTAKPTLLKPGADKLCDIYLLSDEYTILNRVEDWDRNLFDYTVECRLTSKRNGGLVSSGLASCSSYEKKYRWRESKRKCPRCDKETIIKGKAEFSRGKVGFENGGWVCWKKEGKSDGCGAQFADADPGIANQIVGRTENEDIPDLKNTILKMSVKRAKIAAVLAATRSSGIFTQDLEDMPDIVGDHAKPATAQTQQAAPTQPAKETAKPAAQTKPTPAKPPKAEIPSEPLGNEKPAPVKAAEPAKQEAAAPAKAPTSRNQRLTAISNAAAVSTTHMMAFIFRHLNCDSQTIKQVPGKALDGMIVALERTLENFPGQMLRPYLADEQGYDERVKNYFLAVYADTQR